MYPGYHWLRPFVVFSGTITIIQSIAWIVMAILGALVHYCSIDMNEENIFEGLLRMTFYKTYLQGSCISDNFPDQIFGPLDNITHVSPSDVHAFLWVYICVSFIWLLTAILMIAYVRKEYINFANIFLGLWIGVSWIICIYDIVLGSIFAADYHEISMQLKNVDITKVGIEDSVQLFARTSAGIMMMACFRGYVLWLINIAVSCYLCTHTFKIYDYNKVKSGFVNSAFVYDEEKRMPVEPENNVFQPKPWYGIQTEIPRVEHLDSQRAAMSIILDAQQREQARPASEHQNRQGQKNNGMPNPDYSPRPTMKSSLKSSAF